MNMSYCRWRNTLNDLRDCINDATDHINEEAEYKVSPEEINAFKNMMYEAYEFMAYTAGIIGSDGELDDDALERACEALGKEWSEDVEECNW